MEHPEPTCARHPGVVTRLRCVACDDLICADCWREAAIGYKCPDCILADTGGVDPGSRHSLRDARTSGGRSGASGWLRLGQGGRQGAGLPARPSSPAAGPLPPEVLVRSTLVGAAATAVGGLLMVPILLGGFLLLISSGVIGWGVARSVYWAAQERTSSYLRTLALVLPGAAVVVGMLVGDVPTGDGLAFLALPAAVYGGWIVTRQR